MRKTSCSERITGNAIILIFICLLAALAAGQTQEATLNFVPAQTSVNFTLADVLHTVHGSFKLKTGQIRFAPDTNAISGEIIVDATSGNSDLSLIHISEPTRPY